MTIPIIETERTILRPLFSSDAQEIFLLRSDDSVNKYLDRKKATSIEDAFLFINMIKRMADNDESFYWAISFKTTGSLAGTFTFWNIDKEQRRAEIGYEMLPACQGKGLVKEVLPRMLQLGFTSLGFNTIEGWPHASNAPSIHLLKKFGFIRNADAESARGIDQPGTHNYTLLKPIDI